MLFKKDILNKIGPLDPAFFMYFEDKLRYDYKMGFGTASLAYPVSLINEIGQAKKSGVEMSGSEPESE